MLKVIVNGCSGKMGRVLCKCIEDETNLELICGIAPNNTDSLNLKTYSTFNEVKENADVVIDFSHHSTLNEVLNYTLNTKTPLVIATTGYNDDELSKIHEASKIIPLFHSYNMSLGVNLLLRLVKDAAKALTNFDIEVIEKHHNKKVDAPSGTAIMIANAIKEVLPMTENNYGRHGREEKRKENEIGLHAIRGGTIVGEHNVIFAGHDEVVEIKHIAQSKDIFAKGSIVAAKFIVAQEPGYYNMDNMF